ncbi:MAG: terpene synthase [Planctomycetaceae bacterium]|nr:terpene synthase [Planctomycetaceae bacterium]
MKTSLEESYAYCCSLTKRTAGNFHFAFRGLPAETYCAMCALYAFMRETDDIGDDGEQAADDRRERLDDWECELVDVLDGAATDRPGLPALREVVEIYGIPVEHLRAVIEGVRSDLNPVTFATFEELNAYCYQVAGAVGLCCIHIWGFSDPRAEAAAVDCGTAFQLTNILRDLGEDARMGRLYLPAEDLERFGYTLEDIRSGCRDERFARLMEFEVARAREYYAKAESLFEWLAPRGRPILRAMLRIYGGLLGKIERRGYDVYTHRVELARWRKGVIAARAVVEQRFVR